MLNMGGPADPADTEAFLHRLFSDPEMITLGGGWKQRLFANQISKRRAPSVRAQYEQIGGSPIGKYTDMQGAAMCRMLDHLHPSSAPHKNYTCFRYISPMTDAVLDAMDADGVEHAVAFSQYPQWCCNTSGSSMNHLWRELERKGMEQRFTWSIIDRWFLADGYIDALADKIEICLHDKFSESERESVCVLFSAHSIPMKTVQRGDPYVFEVASTVKSVMQRLKARARERGEEGRVPQHQVSWQSKVGFLPWMTPSTEQVVKAVGDKGRVRSLLVVPFVFTSDHIETLYELDIEYREVAEKHGVKKYVRCEALNDSQVFVEGLAQVVREHLEAKQNYSEQYTLRCHDCVNEDCRRIENPRFGVREGEGEVEEAMRSKSL